MVGEEEDSYMHEMQAQGALVGSQVLPTSEGVADAIGDGVSVLEMLQEPYN